MRISENDRILIIAPHPDDECIGCGGLIVLYPGICDVCVLTDGSKSGGELSPQELADVRCAEFEAMARVAGIRDYFMFGYEDSTLIYEPHCCDQIDFGSYTKVFIPMIDDYHADHVAAHYYALKRIRKLGITDLDVYQYEVQTPMWDGDTCIDISGVIEKKIALIQLYQSQIKNYDYSDWVRKLDGNHEKNTEYGMDYTEIYKKVVIKESVHTNNMFELAKYRNRTPKETIIFERWILNSIKDKGPAQRLLEQGVRTIAIFGYGILGKLLYEELRQANLSVVVVIDNYCKQRMVDETPIIKQEEFDVHVDIVVITALNTYRNIKSFLIQKGYKRVIHISELLNLEEV